MCFAAQQSRERLSGRIDTGLVASGDQIQQQAANHGEPESCRGGLGKTFGEGQPIVDRSRNHPVEWLFPVGRSCVALEEEALEGAQFWPANVGPHRGEVIGGIRRQIGQDCHLASLDFLDDRDQHLFSRAEVMQQHSMTCADRGGYVA